MAKELYFFKGPDLSPDLLRLTDFVVNGTTPLEVYEEITVKFNLQNWGQSDIKLGDKGFFVAVKDPDGLDASFGFSFSDTDLQPGDNRTVYASKVLNKVGTWTVWPSYDLSMVTGEILGPDEWHACELDVEFISLPDLVVDSIICDNGNNRIGYIIKNIGEATAQSNHATVLTVDDTIIGIDIVKKELETGEAYQSWFEDYTWIECQNINVNVNVDYNNIIDEEEENNNFLKESCECVIDATPPEIISGPNVSEITQTSATISWVTDEICDSHIIYDEIAKRYSKSDIDEIDVKVHRLELANLEPATTYQFFVESEDPNVNVVRSRTMSFSTSPKPDENNPTVDLFVLKTLSGRARISAKAEDDQDVDRVVFLLDGESFYTDFSPPYRLSLDTREFDDGSHTISVQTFDIAGNMGADSTEVDVQNKFPKELSPVKVEILKPSPNGMVYGKMGILAEVNHDLDSNIRYIEFKLDGEIIFNRTYPDCQLRSETISEPVRIPCGHPPIQETYFYNFSELELDSTHIIEVRAKDEHENWGDTGISVEVKKIESIVLDQVEYEIPVIQANREVRRINNYFEVEITLKNVGNIDASCIHINDTSLGFQCLNKVTIQTDLDGLELKDVNIYNDMQGRWCKLEYLHSHPLRVGEAMSINYNLVPILFDGGGPHIIGEMLSISSGRSIRKIKELAESNTIEVDNAIKAADYLLVTNPNNLFITNTNQSDVSNLLSTMAELAKEKQGVLGYLYSPASFWVDFSKYDGLTSGDFIDDSKNEIAVATDEWQNERNIILYNRYYDDFHHFNAARPYIPIGYTKYDGFEAGDVDDDDKDEIIIATDELSEGNIRIFKINTRWVPITDSSGNVINYRIVYEDKLLNNFYGGFTKYDSLDIGNVLGDEKEEIVIATDDFDDDRNIRIYDLWGNILGYFDGDYTKYDGFTLGDVFGDSKDEILVARDDDNIVKIFDGSGTQVCEFDCGYTKNDAFKTGDILGDEKEELLVASDSSETVSIFDESGNCIRSFDVYYTKYDGFAVGDIHSDSKNEIIVATDEIGMVDIFDESLIRGNRLRLKDLIKKNGSWSSKLEEGWASHGYLLIVGETEIIPAGTIKYNRDWNVRDKERIRVTDIRYGDTSGKVAHPEVIVGRIIGNNAQELIIPIKSSLEEHYGEVDPFEYERALIYSGKREGVSGEADSIRFGVEANSVRRRMRYDGVNSICWIQMDNYEYSNVDYYKPDNPVRTFLDEAVGRDVIHIAGHGFPGGVDHLYEWDIISEEPHWIHEHPVVFCSGCLTGRYVEGVSFAEACLRKGAANYVGASEVSIQPPNREHVVLAYVEWSYGEPIGKALRDQKRTTWGQLGYYWSAIYNLYGDPKYGMGD